MEQFAHDRQPWERVKDLLESRGFGWLELDRRSNVLVSRTDIGFGYPERSLASLLGRYKFRRLLWCLIDKKSGGPVTVEALSRRVGCSEELLQDYLGVLGEHGVVSLTDGRWCLVPEVELGSYGPTFEWYVSLKFVADLHWNAAQSVWLEDAPMHLEDPFNDYDVVAVHGSELAVVECKTSVTIEEKNIDAFASRHRFLKPDLSLFLWDTDKPVDELAEAVQRAMKSRNAPVNLRASQGNGKRRQNRFYWVRPNVYVASCFPDAADGVLHALRLTLRHHYATARRR